MFHAKEGDYTILFDVTELVHGQLDASVTRRVLQREILRRTHSELHSSSSKAGQSASNIPMTQMHSRPSRRVARSASMRVEEVDIRVVLVLPVRTVPQSQRTMQQCFEYLSMTR